MPTLLDKSKSSAAANAGLIKQLYLKWLCGATLRQLSRELEGKIPHERIHSWFRQTYGKHATNLVAMSLARSILEDYRERKLLADDELIELALALVETPETQKHRSEHSVQQLSTFQVVKRPQLMDYLAVAVEDPLITEPPEYWEFLRLPLAQLVFQVVAAGLEQLLVEVTGGTAVAQRDRWVS